MSGVTTLSSCIPNQQQGMNNSSSNNVGGGGGGGGAGGVELTENCGGGGRALKLQTDAPHLVSMGGGRLSTSVTLHPIPPGCVTLGSGPTVDIPVQGTGVSPLHCHIENSEGVVTIYPLSENLSIDGNRITGPTRLSQGVMLTIGRSNYMRFNHPAEAKLMKSVLPNARISMAPITFDNQQQQQQLNKQNKKPPVIPRKSPRESLSDNSSNNFPTTSDEPPSSIMTKVSKFEYLAAQNMRPSIISPKVFSSNLVTVNTPAKDVLGRTPDLESLTKHLPQSAVNYSDLSEKEKNNKTPDRQLFGRKSPQYVNVTINDANSKTINNRVVLYENDRGKNNESANKDLNNKKNNNNQSQNNNMCKLPSPAYNRNPNFFRCGANSGTNWNGDKSIDDSQNGSSSSNSLEDLHCRKKEAEIRRNQAHVDRMKEQEIEKAEQARLEEILNMCAEYEKQAQIEKNNKHVPKGIKTNGSLPRDKRQCISPTLIASSSPNLLSASPNEQQQVFKFDLQDNQQNFSTSSTENVSGKMSPEVRNQACCSPYENINIIPNHAQSPRTRIKTFLINKDSSPKDATMELIETKFAAVNHEHNLLMSNNMQEGQSENKDVDLRNRKLTPTKSILPALQNHGQESYIKPLENYENVTLSNFNNPGKMNSCPRVEITKRRSVEKSEIDRQRMELLQSMKKEKLQTIAKLKRQIAETEIQAEELQRELVMEKALIFGEHNSRQLEVQKLEVKKEKLQKRARKIDEKMKDNQQKQEIDQKECKDKLQQAQETLNRIEEKLRQTSKSASEYESIFEEYLEGQEKLDNERKNFEDLEFHHLEEEADWLASREEIQREIVDLTKKIEDAQNVLSELDQQQLLTSKANSDEFGKIEELRSSYQNRVEQLRNELRNIDAELHNYSVQESEQEEESSEESEKDKEHPQGGFVDFMSCSMIETSKHRKLFDVENMCNMSQSFNEKMLQEKSILEGGSNTVMDRYPSQDDIDRISKVTSTAPIKMSDGQSSNLNRKTIESLQEIEQNRRIHLAQQGSQVIEQERRRVLALKQRVQHEVRTKWAQRHQDCSSLTSTGSEDTQISVMTVGDEVAKKCISNSILGNQKAENEQLCCK